MNTAKRIILVVVSLVIIIYGLVFMSFSGIKNTLLTEDYYQTVVNENNIPEVAHDALGDMIPTIVSDGITEGRTITDPTEKAIVDGQIELFSNAIIDALDKEWIGSQVTLVTDDLVNGLTGDEGTLSAVINLQPKIDLIEANIADGLQQYSDAELMAMFGAPKAYIPVIAEQIVGKLGLPESLVIKDLVNDMAPGTISMVRGYLSTANTFINPVVLIIVLLIFLVLCILLVSRKIGIIWFGATMLLSGILFKAGSSAILSFFSIENIIDSATETLPIPNDLVINIMNYTTSEIGKSSLLFIIIGVIFTVGGILLLRKKQD